MTNTVFLLVTDATREVEDQRQRLRHWLDLLSARLAAQDPPAMADMPFVRARMKVLLVGTKLDLVPPAGAETVRRAAEELQRFCAGRLQLPAVEAVLVSSRDGAGLPRLFQALVDVAESCIIQVRATIALAHRPATHSLSARRKSATGCPGCLACWRMRCGRWWRRGG